MGNLKCENSIDALQEKDADMQIDSGHDCHVGNEENMYRRRGGSAGAECLCMGVV